MTDTKELRLMASNIRIIGYEFVASLMLTAANEIDAARARIAEREAELTRLREAIEKHKEAYATNPALMVGKADMELHDALKETNATPR
jgi:hypothetical protein